MNSTGTIIDGQTYKYVGPVRILKGMNLNKTKSSRTLVLKPEKLDDLPAFLFALKISQSKNPAKAGKTVFKYFSFRMGDGSDGGVFINLAPTGMDLTTDLEQVKAQVISKLANIPNVEYSINVNLPGNFCNVETPQGTYVVFSREQFPNADPMKEGEPPYYLSGEAILRVTLKGAVSQGNEYFQSTFETDQSPEEIFRTRSEGKVWGQEEAAASDGSGDVTPVW